MKYLAVIVYIESFAVIYLIKNTLPPLNLCLYISLNEETIGGLGCQHILLFL
jgi:hypothetical protein